MNEIRQSPARRLDSTEAHNHSGQLISRSRINSIVEQQGVLLLDGGLASELEDQGHDLRHRLWSARLLITDPGAIKDVHRSYLEAGANCITTATYQATIPGLMADGLSRKESEALLVKAVTLACEAREEFVERSEQPIQPVPPLVAASIGPYGAFLADGSEYRGNYGISKAELRDFHEPRWATLAASAADLFACETIPSLEEAEVLLDLLVETKDVQAWISFSCQDGERINDGTKLAECVALFEACEQVLAVGVNCTAPRLISSLIEQIRSAAPAKPIVVYPNSGETYDAEDKCWVGNPDPLDFAREVSYWKKQGAQLIGGCCRTGPDYIKALAKALL